MGELFYLPLLFCVCCVYSQSVRIFCMCFLILDVCDLTVPIGQFNCLARVSSGSFSIRYKKAVSFIAAGKLSIAAIIHSVISWFMRKFSGRLLLSVISIIKGDFSGAIIARLWVTKTPLLRFMRYKLNVWFRKIWNNHVAKLASPLNLCKYLKGAVAKPNVSQQPPCNN